MSIAGSPADYEPLLEDPLGSPQNSLSLADPGVESESSDHESFYFQEGQDASSERSASVNSLHQSEVDSAGNVSGAINKGMEKSHRANTNKKRCRKVRFGPYTLRLKSLDKKTLHKSTPFKCRICRKGFRNNEARTKHMRAYSIHPLQKCVTCTSQQFKNWTEWYRHSQMHNKSYAHKCDVCSQKFRFKSCLVQHKRKHSLKSGPISSARDDCTSPIFTSITTDPMGNSDCPQSCPLLLECMSDSERTAESPSDPLLNSEVVVVDSEDDTRKETEERTASSLAQSNNQSNLEGSISSQPHVNRLQDLSANLFWHPSPSYASGPSAMLHAVNGKSGFQSRHQYYEYYSLDSSAQRNPPLQPSLTSPLPFPFHPLYAPYPSRVVAKKTWQPPTMSSADLLLSQEDTSFLGHFPLVGEESRPSTSSIVAQASADLPRGNSVSLGQVPSVEEERRPSASNVAEQASSVLPQDNSVPPTEVGPSEAPETSRSPLASTDSNSPEGSNAGGPSASDPTRICHICGMVCPDVLQWRLHIATHRGAKRYKCDAGCNRKFATMHDMNSHKENHGEDTAFDCHACGEKCPSVSSWRAHQGTHDSEILERPYKCATCPKRYTSSYSLQVHKLTHESAEKPFKCNICGKGLLYKHTFKKHMQGHAGTKPPTTPLERSICEICGKELSNKYVLKSHLRTHTGERPYKCDECEKTLASLQALQNHKLRHTGVKNYKCDSCDKAYRTTTELKVHQQLHSTDMTHQCVICNEAFPAKRLLRLHMMKHNVREQAECEVCHKKVTKSFLNYHMRKHTGEKPYHCEICGKSFMLKNTWELHMNMHNGIKPYQCNICQRKFSQSHSLKSHLKNIHSVENARPLKSVGRPSGDHREELTPEPEPEPDEPDDPDDPDEPNPKPTTP